MSEESRILCHRLVEHANNGLLPLSGAFNLNVDRYSEDDAFMIRTFLLRESDVASIVSTVDITINQDGVDFSCVIGGISGKENLFRVQYNIQNPTLLYETHNIEVGPINAVKTRKQRFLHWLRTKIDKTLEKVHMEQYGHQDRCSTCNTWEHELGVVHPRYGLHGLTSWRCSNCGTVNVSYDAFVRLNSKPERNSLQEAVEEFSGPTRKQTR